MQVQFMLISYYIIELIYIYIYIGAYAKEVMDSPQWKGLMGGFLQIKATKGKRKNMNNSFIYLIMITVNI